MEVVVNFHWQNIKSSSNTTFTINDTIPTNSEAIANGVNNNFICIGNVIANLFCSEVERVVSSLQNSSAGWYEIPTFVAKNLCL